MPEPDYCRAGTIEDENGAQPATRNLQPVTSNQQPVTSNSQPTTRFLMRFVKTKEIYTLFKLEIDLRALY
jgi:hypothetical protein